MSKAIDDDDDDDDDRHIQTLNALFVRNWHHDI